MNSRSGLLYSNSWWLPAVVFLANLAALSIVRALQWRPLAIVRFLLVVSLVIAYLGILSASVWNFIQQRWAKAVVNLAMLPVCAAVFWYVTLYMAMLEGRDI